PVKASFTADSGAGSIRDKCRELIATALRGDDVNADDAEFVDDLAADIEKCIYQEFKDTNPKYKNRIRSRVSNLKDAKNPDLRNNVLSGAIPAHRIAVMTAEVGLCFKLCV